MPAQNKIQTKSEDLERCLDDLESRIDPLEEERVLHEWADFTHGRFEGDIFTPRRAAPSPPETDWPAVSVNEALEDFDAMALQQYAASSATLAGAGGAMLNIRANYGTAILPSLFGAELFVMSDESNTLPTTLPFKGTDAIRRVVDAGTPDLRAGYGGRVLEMGERFAAIGRERPLIGRHIHVYHPDVQGPMDVCELLWGSDLFYALIETPDLVYALLQVVTETYTAFLREWERTVPFRAGGNAHWGLFHRGNIMLRDDSAMNLSPQMFDEFVRPYDQRLLDEFGGGGIHFCGRGDHYIERMSTVSGLYAIAMSQPDCNDMETVFAHTVDKGICLVGLDRKAADEALARGRSLRGRVHCS